MRRSLLVGAVALLAACIGIAPAHASASPRVPRRSTNRVCARVAGAAHCLASVAYVDGAPLAKAAGPSGLDPATMKAAYRYSTSPTAGEGRTIAIVDAYDDHTAEKDLAVFSTAFGLPPCTTANGCFTKVNQTGGTKYPGRNRGWTLESSLDVQWAHAIAPGAHILLVEAKDNQNVNLYTAEDYARTHAQYVSNSWGGGESQTQQFDDAHFRQSGVSIFAAAGDDGAKSGAEFPAASPDVVAVGGTTLHFDAQGHFASETGWTDGGGGCSEVETMTAAQHSVVPSNTLLCPLYVNGFPDDIYQFRATPDFSLDADPFSGASVYDGAQKSHGSHWWVVGGTSLSSPMAAARAATTGTVLTPAKIYGNSMSFRDVTVGSNGYPCKTGYDLCSGRGSWISATP